MFDSKVLWLCALLAIPGLSHMAAKQPRVTILGSVFVIFAAETAPLRRVLRRD